MKIKLIILLAFAFSLMACENQEIEQEDFGSTTVYFPFQSPVRTLILGEYDLGFNDNDNNGRFEIGVIMGGVVENKRERRISYALAPELIDPIALGVPDVNVKILPASYYTILQPSLITIPAGSTSGRVTVQLEDAFFDDPLSFGDFGTVNYVIPLRITAIEGIDSLLTGVPIVPNPIKIKADDWNPLPKDYTLFGIKYMNRYQGVYLRRGADNVVGTSSRRVVATNVTTVLNISDNSVYRAEFIERDEVVPVATSGRNSAKVTNRVRRGALASDKNVTLNLAFDASGNITITNVPGDLFTVTGTGKYVLEGDEWGGKKRNVMYLEYQYRDVDVVQERVFGNLVAETTLDLLHTVKDTLVIRDRNVKFEEFTVNLTGL